MTEVQSPPQEVNRTGDIFIRRVNGKDRDELVYRAQQSVSLHHPWVTAPSTNQTFRMYLRRMRTKDHEGFVICVADSREIAGVVNLNNIVFSSYMTSSVGYYGFKGFSGQGYMTNGLIAVVDYAFNQLGLHRVEANIQPGNTRSLKLAKRCGFVYEGMSERFMFINGHWCDHERWARIASHTSLRPSNSLTHLWRAQ